MADDYTFEITFEGERNGMDVIEITCHPKPGAAVVWGKVIETVRLEDYLPVDLKYYDEDMKLARTFIFSKITTLGGKSMPSLMTVVPEDKPGEKTEVLYEDMAFDVDLRVDLFSLRTLRR
jgi:hypothetical protein